MATQDTFIKRHAGKMIVLGTITCAILLMILFDLAADIGVRNNIQQIQAHVMLMESLANETRMSPAAGSNEGKILISAMETVMEISRKRLADAQSKDDGRFWDEIYMTQTQTLHELRTIEALHDLLCKPESRTQQPNP